MDNSANISIFVKKIRDLPTLPQYILKISKAVNNPKTSAKELAKLISEDQVLTARLLRLVNSSFYGFPQKVTTITAAIVLLGFEAIKNLLLSTSLLDIFYKGVSIKQDAEELWNHVLCCGIVAKVIGEKINYNDTEELFVAGLLHDIGKTVELMSFPDKYQEIVKISKEDNVHMKVLEEKIFGISHDQVGKMLASYWKLPKKLQDVMEFHHNIEGLQENHKIVCTVHLADIIAKTIALALGEDTTLPEIVPSANEVLGLTLEDFMPLAARSRNIYLELKEASFVVT